MATKRSNLSISTLFRNKRSAPYEIHIPIEESLSAITGALRLRDREASRTYDASTELVCSHRLAVLGGGKFYEIAWCAGCGIHRLNIWTHLAAFDDMPTGLLDKRSDNLRPLSAVNPGLKNPA